MPVDRPYIARHETFTPRFGWLKKGFDQAAKNGGVFLRDDATVVFGVGVNMVRAIRYWCMAFKLIEELPGRGRSRAVAPTDFGQSLLDDEAGTDPYLEQSESLWLLHWRLLQEPCYATAWDFVFSRYTQREFTKSQVAEEMADFIGRTFPQARTSKNSIKRDIDCLLLMYTARHGKGFNEDRLDCPFSSLGLIQRTDKSSAAFNVGRKRSLPADVVTACCLEFAERTNPGQGTIAVSRLLYEPESPGMVFKLDEQALLAYLEETISTNDVLSLADTAGLVQLSFRGNASVLAAEILVNNETGACRSGEST